MLNISGLKLPMIGDMLVGGNVYFVDSGAGLANDENDGLHPVKSPLATITGALALCTASNGDFIVCLPGHAEAPTATIDVNKIGVSIVGIGNGRLRPSITHAHTVDHDHVLDITVANVLVKNIRFVAGTNTGGHSEQINIAADDAYIQDCVIEMGAANEVGISVAGLSDRFHIEDCLFLGTGSSQADVAIDLEGSGAHNDFVVRRCDFNFMSCGAGLLLAGIRSSKDDLGVIIEDCTFIEMATTAIDFDSTAEGIIRNCTMHTATTSIAEVIDLGNLMIGPNVMIAGAATLGVAHATSTLGD